MRLTEVVVKRITVIKFGVNDGGGNGARCVVFTDSQVTVSFTSLLHTFAIAMQ